MAPPSEPLPPPAPRVHSDEAGVLTEVLRVAARPRRGSTARPARLLVVVLPGNPGAAAFYGDFATRLALEAGGDADVAVCGHASHAAATASPRHFTLDDQVAHKLRFVRAELARDPHLTVALVGHSVGAYMALELAARLPPRRVAAVVGLFPTLLHIASTPRGRALSPLFTSAGLFVIATLAWLLRVLLPLTALEFVAARLALPRSASAAAVAAAAGIVHERVASNALFLARTEMREIRAVTPEARAAAASLGSRCLLYFGAGDHWNCSGDEQLVASELPLARVVTCSEGHAHSFVLSARSCQLLAQTVWQHVAASLTVTAGGAALAGPPQRVRRGSPPAAPR